MRQEALELRSAGRVPADSVDRMVVLQAEDYLCDKEMSINDVSSEGLQCWNTDMDIANQYETLNGLPVYYGGDMYESEDSEENDPLVNGHDMEDFCQWSELSDDVGSSVDSSLYMSEEEDLGYVDVESVVDFDSEDSLMDFCINSNEGSMAELEWNTWDDTCALDFQNASGVFPTDSAVVRLAVSIT